MSAEVSPAVTDTTTGLSHAFEPVGWSDMAGWADDRHDLALGAFRRSARHALDRPYKSGSLGISAAAFGRAYRRALDLPDSCGAAAARRFFEVEFRPFLIRPEGFVTGFYEPEVDASAVETRQFRYPLLARPDDLVAVDDENRPAGMDPYLAFGRQEGGRIVEYFDRRAIEGGALAGRGLEIAWLADPVDAFFIHVQGAARLRMEDGRTMRVTYAAKSGQRFTGPGGILATLGEIPPAEVTMQAIRAWFLANPHRVDEILHQNRSFIFFREAPVVDPTLGPIAAAKVPLTAGRSMAVDRLLHTFGTPFFIGAPTLTAFDGMPFRRLMIAQDTGSAITGPARGDLFAGSGDLAGDIAGVVRHAAAFTVLVPVAQLDGRSR